MFEIDDYEVMEFPERARSSGWEPEPKSWIRVELREPMSKSRPYLRKEYSVYFAANSGKVIGIYLTSQQARKLATILIVAADKTDESNEEMKNDIR